MRRYGNPERYLDSFRSAAEKLRSHEILRNIDEQPTIYESEDEEEIEDMAEEEYSESEQIETEDNVESKEEQDEKLQLRFF